MDRNLALEAVRVTEAAALASARLMGHGDAANADVAAVKAMHKAFKAIAIRGTVVVGEGDEEQVPMLYTGEKVGVGNGPRAEVALDALEGAESCASGGSNVLSIIAMGEPDAFLRCPETYMNKIAVGPDGYGAIDLDRSPTDNLKAFAESKGVYVEDITVAILHRPRHTKLIKEVRKAGARIKVIGAGDLSAALATMRPGSGVDMLMGIGGSLQGLLAAAALCCGGGDMQVRLTPLSQEEVSRCYEAGLTDLDKKLTLRDLVRGEVMFAATGVTDGEFLDGVRFFRGGATTNSVVMRSSTRTIRYIHSRHRFDFKPDYS